MHTTNSLGIWTPNGTTVSANLKLCKDVLISNGPADLETEEDPWNDLETLLLQPHPSTRLSSMLDTQTTYDGPAYLHQACADCSLGLDRL